MFIRSRRTRFPRFSFIAGTTKLATVRSATPSATCPGFAYKATGGCSACANRGLGSALTGATSATCTSDVNSPCCNLPYFFLSFTGPTVTQYALMEFNVVSSVRPTALAMIPVSWIGVAYPVALFVSRVTHTGNADVRVLRQHAADLVQRGARRDLCLQQPCRAVPRHRAGFVNGLVQDEGSPLDPCLCAGFNNSARRTVAGTGTPRR